MYKYIINSLITVFIFILLEGIIVFAISNTLAPSIYQNTIDSTVQTINSTLAKNQAIIDPYIKEAFIDIPSIPNLLPLIAAPADPVAPVVVPGVAQNPGNIPAKPKYKESPEFINLAIRLFIVGYMGDEINAEDTLILKRQMASYASFFAYICFFIIIIIIVYIVNFVIGNRYESLHWGKIMFNQVVFYVLFLVFMVAVVFSVFINLNQNIDSNALILQVLKTVKKTLNSN